MPRKSLIRTNEFPYHITARANNRETFHLPLDKVWKIFGNHCFEISLLFGTQIHAFVLMNNHIHMLITAPNEDIGKVMMHFMRSTTRTMNSHSGRSGHVFSGRYHWSLIQSDLYFAHAYKYVFRNPVRAGACSRVEDYSYTSLAGVLGMNAPSFPVFYPFKLNAHTKIPNDLDKLLSWLNQPFKIEHQEAIQKGLHRTRFELPKMGWRRTLEELNKDLI